MNTNEALQALERIAAALYAVARWVNSNDLRDYMMDVDSNDLETILIGAYLDYALNNGQPDHLTSYCHSDMASIKQIITQLETELATLRGELDVDGLRDRLAELDIRIADLNTVIPGSEVHNRMIETQLRLLTRERETLLLQLSALGAA